MTDSNDVISDTPASPVSGEISETPSTEPSASTAAKDEKKAFVNPATLPTQEGPGGIRYDFNLGCRVQLPEGEWTIRLTDLDTGNILFETKAGKATVNSAKRFYVRFGIEVKDAAGTVFTHEFDCRGREVLVQLPVGTLGDTLGWFPYVARLGEVRGCRLTCVMAAPIIPLFRATYPQIVFITPEELEGSDRLKTFYATYTLGLFFEDSAHVWQPSDFRLVGLHRTAGYILGVDPTEEPPEIAPDEDPSRPIEEPYVCIAAQSSSQCKYWNNPDGWRQLVAFLRESGYRVICIDQKPVHGTGIVWNHIPYGAEDQTGNRSLAERVRWLRHAAFFVGLSSGLSWLAWAARCKVVMISGFTHPTNEFHTPWRIINWHACNSCWHDPACRFDHKDFLWCPRHAGTGRQFECTRLITVEHVKRVIETIPDFSSMNVTTA
ncbi:autotransporter strand-loop-strand O-heptosyltransferase [Acetobacter sp.]|jgi:autotransporter strand-loop-strand O-heptosyltransferase|uniref:autotransporter strand-loop-strand O-heptosyltransferase n=1 Tax=Acetobacter sp. TaxID=440 RepID=UPI0025C54BD8|nr:autotransporter strand-loop-strand O-heptosyltransferase [Acetobacter sp.]MCH4092017.1 autotransporter strand-loop-strand O-heptosyltransferase [Acetobacter sp.]MCI1300729.1 autotransporter strand-loop-strand O-heptosyltransferase [Acetobacter sp.]MCI1317519.1 autotransporter strand-loop-strand O-heptosyltransferase [Acetobacter sp.]